MKSLITTMGLFWNVANVEWGRPGRRGLSGKIIGVRTNAKRGKEIDFADQVGIYALYADFRLVYIGQTGRGKQALLTRLRQHRVDDLAGRWTHFSWFGVRRVLKTGELAKKNAQFHPGLVTLLDQIEGIIVHAAEPALNRQRGRMKRTVVRYLQKI